MTEKQIDRALKLIKRRKPITVDKLMKRFDDLDASLYMLHPYATQGFIENKDGYPDYSSAALALLTDEGQNRLDEKREAGNEKRWTRGLSIIAVLISLASLAVSIITLSAQQ